MILIKNWRNHFLFALLHQKEQIEQFTNLASKHVQEWIEGGHDVKENIATLINEGKQSNDGTPEDNDKENRKRKPHGETNNSQEKKVKKKKHHRIRLQPKVATKF